MLLGRPRQGDESHNTYSLFGGPDSLQALRTIIMDSQKGKSSRIPIWNSPFPSLMDDEDSAPESVQPEPWCPARKFSDQGTTWVPQIGPWSNTLFSFSPLIYDPEVNLSAQTHKDMASSMGSNFPGLVLRSSQANRFYHQGDVQHTAATSAITLHCSMGPASPEPRVSPTLPGDFVSLFLEAEDQVPDNSAKPAEKASLIGSPRGWDSGFFNIWRRPPLISPELLPLSPFLGRDSEPRAQPSSCFRPPVSRACRRRLLF